MTFAPIVRWLRMGLAAVSLLALMLFVALWVRSYRQVDIIQTQKADRGVILVAGRGDVSVTSFDLPEPVEDREWMFDSYSASDAEEFLTMPGMGQQRSPGSVQITLPYWLYALVAASFATLFGWPWLRSPRQFGLRTLLIAMTIVAVQLGLIVLFCRNFVT